MRELAVKPAVQPYADECQVVQAGAVIVLRIVVVVAGANQLRHEIPVDAFIVVQRLRLKIGKTQARSNDQDGNAGLPPAILKNCAHEHFLTGGGIRRAVRSLAILAIPDFQYRTGCFLPSGAHGETSIL